MNQGSIKRIFLSYDEEDESWAKWVWWHLEDGGYPTQRCWDLKAGSNREVEWNQVIKRVDHTVVLFSPAYLKKLDKQPGWSAALAKDPGGHQGKLIPVRIQECQLSGQFTPITAIDLFGLTEGEAREKLLTGISRKRPRLNASPMFPPSVQQALSGASPHFPGPQPLIYVPYRRNPLFTGRDELLQQLYQRYRADTTGFPTPLALCGLSGIGKTQIAIEYAYRYRDRYHYILWMNADSRDRLGRDIMTLATQLRLPGSLQTPAAAIQAAKQWLETTGQWLLVLDHVNHLRLIRSCIPQRGKGHILVTTCSQITGDLADCIPVEKLTVEEGTPFLFNRAKINNPGSRVIDSEAVKKIYHVMDGLPLALDQVGAYIEEASCSLRRYLDLYKQQPMVLLKRRGGMSPDHSVAVADAWLQSLTKIEQANPAAVKLLWFCSFLNLPAIPEEIIIAGGSVPGFSLAEVATNSVALDEAIQELRKHSFIRRDPNTSTLFIHPLMQVILQDKMKEEEKREWAEWAVRAVKQVFPGGELPAFQACERYAPHVRVCVKHISHWGMGFIEAIELLKIEEQILSQLMLYGR